MKNRLYLFVYAVILAFFVAACSLQSDQARDPVIFLQKRNTSGSGMASELRGKLILIESCLRIRSDDNPKGSTVIWPNGYDYAIENNSVKILNNNGDTVAHVGEQIYVGGGGVPGRTPDEWAGYVTGDAQRCAEPFWAVSTVVTNE